MPPPAVRVHALTKDYRSGLSRSPVRALDGITLEVRSGEVFGLLGPNGAGKTTLVKILLGIVHPTVGDAALLGVSARNPEARRRVGFLPENHRFPGFLTPRHMLDLYGRMAGVPAAVRKRRIEELVDLVDMSRWIDTRIRKFSKGMMQRIGLAQALLNEPDLVFLDEPTDGVDPIGRREIRDLLLLLRDRGTTVFLNSHLLSEIEQVCTRVAILNKGRLVREGTVAELTTTEPYYELVTTPIPQIFVDAMPALEPMPGAGDGLSRYRARIADRNELNTLLDRLRGAGVLLDAVRPVRRTLEESFIDVVQELVPDGVHPVAMDPKPEETGHA